MQAYESLGNRRSTKSKVAAAVLIGVVAITGCVFMMNQNASPVSLFSGLEAGSVEDQLAFFNMIAKHGKQYSSHEEMRMRFGLFVENMKFIREVNAEETTYKLGPNQFSDLTVEEKQQVLGHNAQLETPEERAESIRQGRAANPRVGFVKATPTVGTANSVDWRDKAPPIRNQKQCGSCWSFSCIGSLECYVILYGGAPQETTALSEQQVVSCDNTCYGCNGGLARLCMAYIHNNGGVVPLADWPYTATDGTCSSHSGSKWLGTGKGYHLGELTDAEVYDNLSWQPISACVFVDDCFMNYDSGVLTATSSKCKCNSAAYCNHAIVIIGYNIEENWYCIRNSWGPNWGEKGYIFLSIKAPTAKGTCLIKDDITYWWGGSKGGS